MFLTLLALALLGVPKLVFGVWCPRIDWENTITTAGVAFTITWVMLWVYAWVEELSIPDPTPGPE